MLRNSIIQWFGMAALAVVLTVVCSPVAHAAGCFSASIDSRVLLPGGEEVESGLLTLCVTRDLSPVAALHKTYIDGNPVAMFVSRRGFSEGSADGRPFMMFNRDSNGTLRLYGFAAPSDGRMVTYHVAGGPAADDSLQMAINDSNHGSARPAQSETLSTILVSAVGPSNGR
jgi:hypothetical protein